MVWLSCTLISTTNFLGDYYEKIFIDHYYGSDFTGDKYKICGAGREFC
jgi:hypothetical protein